jgi:hypothetical protein
VILDVLGVEQEHLRPRPDAVLEGIRYPGLQEQYELLDPEQNNLPPLLEQIRQLLYAHGVIPSNTPLPATVDTFVRSLARGG